MTKSTKRFLSVFIAVTILFTAFAGMSVVRSDAASYPKGYPNTYKNTGSGANDIIGVARTQIGYQENYVGTKYGDWYNGYFVNQPWCAMFVSWCADQAGIPQSVIAKYAACGTEVEWFKAIGRWHDSKAFGGNYTPQKGDLIFYRDSGSNCISTHTGLVAGLNGNYIVTIEGNSTNAAVCEFRTSQARSLDSSYVIGYGNPNYSNSIENEPDTYERWQVTADGLSLREDASTDSARLKTVPYATVLNVKQFKLAGGYLWGYTKYSSKKGWVALDYCEYICGSIDGEYYQLAPSVSPTKKTLYVDYSTTLQVTNGRGVKYKSSDETVATVTKKGKVKALKKGTAKISCTTNTGTAVCKITVKNPSLSTQKASVCVGDKISLSVKNSKATPVWTSSDPDIAKAGKTTGNVKGISPGTAVITATVGDVQLTCEVTVTEFPTTYERFTANHEQCYLYIDNVGTSKLKKIPNGTQVKVTEVVYSEKYTWGKTNYKSADGWILINRFKYDNGSIDGTTYTVRPYLSKASKNIYITSEYTIPLKSASGKTTYKSSNDEVATVSDKGVVKGHTQGTAKIAIVSNGTKLSFKVNVKNPKLSASELSLVKGKTEVLTVHGGDSEINWSCSDENVATVSEEGTVTAVGLGEAEIKAIRNDVAMSCKVSVYDPVLSKKSVTAKIGKIYQLTVSQSSGAAITWESSKPTVVKVNAKGRYKGLKAGTAYIYATVDGVKLKCKVKVVAG